MNVLAVIPARLAATRHPRKPLRLVGGVPLVVRVWERVRAMGVAHRCVVATDAPEIMDVLRAAGAECVLTRDDHPSGTDRVAEVVARPEYGGCAAVLNVQGDEPFVAAEAVRGALAMVTERGFALGTVAVPASPTVLEQPSVVKVVAADDGRAMYFSRAPIPWLRDPSDAPARDPLVRQHVGVYAYTPAALAAWVRLAPHPLELAERLEQLRPLAAGIPMGVAVVDDAGTGGIDTEDDLVRANAHWETLSAGTR